jgi:hypothetical protein|uniref:YopX protein n=1 Tax=Siphoviridae sp. ctOow3 TaxID=2826315 RepID=A0A8S5QYT3_9CAUD|nr:MAG TPA: YopX protein [Siphoviridae sp. ctOow3]
MIPKFRAWDTTKKEMFKDTFAITESGQVVVVDQSSVFVSPDYVFVDNLVIMQSTGLKDKNGQEIFEGDILEVTDKHSWLEIVSYSQEKAMFVTEEINREFKVPESPLYDLFDTNIFKFKVIGNIYENQELLEVE